MKNYVYAILFLMWGLAHFATQVQAGNCIWGGQIYNPGSYTIRPCRRLTCHENGIISILGCPPLACSSAYLLTGHTRRDEKKEYPDCCQQPICLFGM